MTNNKVKHTSNTPLHRLRDEMLFIRRFHHVMSVSPDEVREQLERLAYQPDGLTRVFFPRQRFVEIDDSDDVIHFTIKTKVGGLYTELKTNGTIHYDAATRQTVVSGQVKFDPVYLAVLLAGLFMLITWGLAGLAREGITASPFLMFTLGLTNLFYFQQMFRDRDALLNILADIGSTTDITAARNRLTDKTIDVSSDNITQSTSQHSQEVSS